MDDDTATTFLCCIKRGYEERHNTASSFVIPPRYIRQEGDQLTVEQLTQYFNGERPKMLGQVEVSADYDLSVHSDIDLHADANILFLSEIDQLLFVYEPFQPLGVKFIMTMLRIAKHLELLVLRGNGEPPNAAICIDEFCTELTSCSSFWSTFRMFKILSRLVCDECSLEYSISRDTFNSLIKAYFAAPTDHNQMVQFTDTKIEGDSSDRSPTIDQTYLKYKTVRLENCRFVSSSKATAKTITTWLGREIDVLENKQDSCLFQIKDKRGRKRKYQDQEE